MTRLRSVAGATIIMIFFFFSLRATLLGAPASRRLDAGSNDQSACHVKTVYKTVIAVHIMDGTIITAQSNLLVISLEGHVAQLLFHMTSGSAMDALSVLREYTQRNLEVKVEGDQVIFGQLRYGKDMETAWRARGRQGRGGATSYYKLHELVVLMQNAHLAHNEYIRKIGVLKLPSFVGKLDFDDLVRYLRGETATSNQIDMSRLLPRSSSVLPATGVKRQISFGVNSRENMPRPDGICMRYQKELGTADDETQLEQILKAKRSRLCVLESRSAKPFGLTKEESELCKLDGELHRLLKSSEQVVNDRNSILLTVSADYRIALEALEKIQKNAKEPATKGKKTDARHIGLQSQLRSLPSARSIPANFASNHRGKGLDPIIIVPSDPGALISLLNVADFLENSQFVGAHERGTSAPVSKRVKQLTVTKTIADRPTKFKVIDNPQWLQDEEWDAVVAVFCNGKAWQFSDWKYSTPVELFQRCLGVMVHYDDEPLKGEAKGWNVRFYKINKTKRHMDGLAASSFWLNLTDWMRTHSPCLLKGRR